VDQVGNQYIVVIMSDFLNILLVDPAYICFYVQPLVVV